MFKNTIPTANGAIILIEIVQCLWHNKNAELGIQKIHSKDA